MLLQSPSIDNRTIPPICPHLWKIALQLCLTAGNCCLARDGKIGLCITLTPTFPQLLKLLVPYSTPCSQNAWPGFQPDSRQSFLYWMCSGIHLPIACAVIREPASYQKRRAVLVHSMQRQYRQILQPNTLGKQGFRTPSTYNH